MLSWSTATMWTSGALRSESQVTASVRSSTTRNRVRSVIDANWASAVLVDGIVQAEGVEHVDAVVSGPVGEGNCAARRPSSSWACAGRSHAAWGRGRRHHPRTAGRGSSPGGRGRCPSACRACDRHRDLAPTLGRVRALARRGSLRDDDLVDQRDVDLHVEDVRRQVDLRDAALGGGLLRGRLLAGAFLAVDFLAADFLAVCVSAMVTPPSSWQPSAGSRGRLGAGHAPLTRIRPRSVSTAWTVRFWVVTVSVPIRSAIRTPLKTRPGVAQAPIEPGLRWFLWAPWEDETPAKPCAS